LRSRYFLAFESNSDVRWFEGSFEEYERWRKDWLPSPVGSTIGV
jgi:hypothetical protein